MTILRIINRGLDRDAYTAVIELLNLNEDHPLGLIMHGATEVDGTVQVAQVWDSEWYAQRFDDERLKAALQEVGAKVEGADVTTFKLHHLITP